MVRSTSRDHRSSTILSKPDPTWSQRTDDKQWRENIRKFALKMLGGSPTKRLEQAQFIASRVDASVMTQIRDRQRAMFAAQVAIFSMSAVRDDPLLWAHGANQSSWPRFSVVVSDVEIGTDLDTYVTVRSVYDRTILSSNARPGILRVVERDVVMILGKHHSASSGSGTVRHAGSETATRPRA
jgi:hypothetical protein